LLPEPADLQAFGQAVRLLLGDPAEATQMGVAAQAYVRDHCLGDIHLMRYARLLGTLISEGLSPRHRPVGAGPAFACVGKSQAATTRWQTGDRVPAARHVSRLPIVATGPSLRAETNGSSERRMVPATQGLWP
jgi:hypothetical protein